MTDLGSCLEWDGQRGRGGYGRFTRWGKTRYLHRIVWEATEGPIPDDHDVMHLCDNPACYRRSHLKLGTQAENVQDAISKSRWTTGRSKYPAHILGLILSSPLSSRKLSAELGIPDNTIRRLRRSAR